MRNDPNLQFIREKIYDIRSAIMYSMSNDLVKLPNNIVTAVKVDNDGNLWFTCKRPAEYIDQCEATFPVRLHFYRKGAVCHIEVSGKATIVNEDRNAPFITTTNGSEKPLLVKMSMNTVEYTQPQEKKKNKFEIILEQGYRWLLRTVAVSHDTRPILAKLQSMNRA